MLSLLQYETTVGCQFHLHVALIFIFVVTYTALTSSNEVCFQGKANQSVTCKSNWSIRANVTLTGYLRCVPFDACRFKLSAESCNLAVLSENRCPKTVTVHGNSETACQNSTARVNKNLTYVTNCSNSSLNISFTVSVLGVFNPVDVIILVAALDVRKDVMLLIANVSSCSRNANSNVFVSTSNSPPGFRDNGTFQCGHHPGQVFYENATRAISTWCNAHAQWEDIDKVHCHYSPTVNFMKQALRSGFKNNVSSICNVSDGYPRQSLKSLKIYLSGDTKLINERNGDFYVPNPSHHGLNASCFTANSFGNDSKNSTLNITFQPMNVVICNAGSSRYSAKFHLSFKANPQGVLHVSGLRAGMVANKSCEASEITVNCTVLLNNVTSNDSIIATYEQNGENNTRLGALNVTQQCVEVDRPTTVISTTSVKQSSNATIVSSVHPTTEGEGNHKSLLIVAAAVGGVLIIAIFVVITLFFRRRRKSGRHEALSANIATAESSFSKMQGNGERLEQTNIIYDTADLKSGGGTKEVVENVLYGTAVNAANYDSKTKKKEGTTKRNTDSQDKLYSTVQKPGNKKEKGEDAGASTSGLQMEGAYAVPDKEKKKGKKRAEKNSGSENAGFSGDLQEDATYAVVDKKKAKGKGEATYAVVDKKNKKETKNKEDATYAVVDKKNKKEDKGKEESTYAVLDKKNKKNGKGKGNDGPSTSGLVEDCTYAEVKKDKKKPKKDGDDGDLHGSSK